PEGRLTVHIGGQTLYAINGSSHRAAGSTFDAFGMGMETSKVSSSYTGADPTSTVQAFIDDVQYSGHTGTVNFNTDPGWTAVGNTSDGNNYGWSHQLARDGFETNSSS